MSHILLLATLSDTCIAHQLKHATTLIDFKHGSLIEISHRFYLHDAESVLASLSGKHRDLLQNQKAQSALCDYISAQFQLRYQAEEPAILKNIGCEIEGKYFWAYQESSYEHLPSNVQVKFSAFQEEIPEHINLINVQVDQKVRSLELKAKDNWKTLILESSKAKF